MAPTSTKARVSRKATSDPHAPVNKLTHVTEARKKQVAKFLNDFNYSDQYIKELANRVQDQIKRSYDHHKADAFAVYDQSVSDFRSLDTCVSNTPSGTETGTYYGIDVGGSNLRVVRCYLKGGGESSMDADKYDIRSHIVDTVAYPKGLLDKHSTASMLMDFIAEAVKKLVNKYNDQNTWLSIGFTFSFAIQMILIDRAIVTGLSKGFETGVKTQDPLIGQDCVAMLNHALKRKKIKAVVAGCLNDTTGTLLTAAYEVGKHPNLPPVKIGMIIGTGFNTCVQDPKALSYGYQGSLINLESGGLVSKDHLVDLMLDMESSNRGEQNCEKKISGAYLCDVARQAFIHVLQSEAPPQMYIKGSLNTVNIANIFNNYHERNERKRAVQQEMQDCFGWVPPSNDHCDIIADVVYAVWNRSACIVAAIIAGCAEQTERLRRSMGGLTMGVDGSVYCNNPNYQDLIRKHLKTILADRHELLHIIQTADGSGKGAAMLACANPVDFVAHHD